MTVGMASEPEAAEEDANECPACGHSVYQAEALLAGKTMFFLKIVSVVICCLNTLQQIVNGINVASNALVVKNF